MPPPQGPPNPFPGRGAENSAEHHADVRISAWTPPRFFDAAGGLPLSPLGVEWLTRAWGTAWADPLGRHEWAARSSAVLAESRSRFARFLGCSPAEVWFAPNADTALAAAVAAIGSQESAALPIVVSPLERVALLRAADAQAAAGAAVITLPVDASGRIDPDLPQLRRPARLVAVQAANREIGTLQPIDAIAAAVSGMAPLVVDASAVRCAADLPRRWDAIVLEPASWGGPAGIAVLACRTGVSWTPSPPALAQERFPGRLSIPDAAAAAMTVPDSPEHAAEELRIRALAEWLSATILRSVPHVQVHGFPGHRLGHILSMSILYISAEQLVDDLARDGFSVHSGSACTSDTRRPSHVLTAIGALTHGNLRISLPPGCSVADVRALAAALPVRVQQQRREAGLP